MRERFEYPTAFASDGTGCLRREEGAVVYCDAESLSALVMQALEAMEGWPENQVVKKWYFDAFPEETGGVSPAVDVRITARCTRFASSEEKQWHLGGVSLVVRHCRHLCFFLLVQYGCLLHWPVSQLPLGFRVLDPEQLLLWWNMLGDDGPVITYAWLREKIHGFAWVPFAAGSWSEHAAVASCVDDLVQNATPWGLVDGVPVR